MSVRTVGIILADSALSGKKYDFIINYLTQELYSLQYTIKKVTILLDREKDIFNELDLLIKSCDVILTISEKSTNFFSVIGRMISQELQECEELITFLKENKEPYEKGEVSIPVQSRLLHGVNIYPIVCLQRIFILKEKYLEECFTKILKSHLMQYRKDRLFERVIEICQNGNSISNIEDMIKMKTNGVSVDVVKGNKTVTCKISSQQLDLIVGIMSALTETFKPPNLQFLDNTDVWDMVYLSGDNHLRSSFEIIETYLEKYGIENVFVCFNGGKDCTVLLHLVLTVIKKKYPEHTDPIFCLYVQSDMPFQEQDEFINQIKLYYNLRISTIKAGIKDALKQTLEIHSNYKACFMGTRRSDPFSSEIKISQMTDSNWPQILRVHPILEWYYSDIWDYLLYYKVPYCKLYDKGYTSLGNTVNTVRNPSLLYYDYFEGKEIYLEAFKLLNQVTERNGRS